MHIFTVLMKRKNFLYTITGGILAMGSLTSVSYTHLTEFKHSLQVCCMKEK